MDFYSRQAAARSETRWLVLAFILCLLAVALALDLVLFTFLASSTRDQAFTGVLDYALSNPGQTFFCTFAAMGLMGVASLYKSMELRGGGGVVARALGGVRIARDTSDLKRKRLLNVVEEMAIASGVPMPEVYVLEQEPAINAFAAGHTAANAAVTVTQGALDRLNRDQLQGVIAHEFSHILNGDMRLNLQLMGWVFGLFVIALVGRNSRTIDFAACTELGIPVATGTSNSPVAPAELALALILASRRNVAIEAERMKHGEWPCTLSHRLRGSTLGRMIPCCAGRPSIISE